MRKYSLFIFIFFFAFLGKAQKMTLKDSLLAKCTIDELKAMTFEERVNVRRKLRGLPPLPPKKEKVYDWYGIKIVKNIPKEIALKKIKEVVETIKKEKVNYHQEVFPNNSIDIMDNYFGGFYEDFRTRKLLAKDYKNYFSMTIDGEGPRVNEFSNFSRRKYYLNSKNQIKLILVEAGFNINKGKEMYNTDMIPFSYSKLAFYIDNDSLLMVHILNAEQNIQKDHTEYINQIDLDTTKIDATENYYYYYKNNCFKHLMKKGSQLKKDNWENRLATFVLSESKQRCNSQYSARFKNYMLEYEDYKKGITDYLYPTDSSFIQIYTVPPSE